MAPAGGGGGVHGWTAAVMVTSQERPAAAGRAGAEGQAAAERLASSGTGRIGWRTFAVSAPPFVERTLKSSADAGLVAWLSMVELGFLGAEDHLYGGVLASGMYPCADVYSEANLDMLRGMVCSCTEVAVSEARLGGFGADACGLSSYTALGLSKDPGFSFEFRSDNVRDDGCAPAAA